MMQMSCSKMILGNDMFHRNSSSDGYDSSSMVRLESPSKVLWCHPFLLVLVNVATGDACRCNSSTVGLWTSDTWKKNNI